MKATLVARYETSGFSITGLEVKLEANCREDMRDIAELLQALESTPNATLLMTLATTKPDTPNIKTARLSIIR